MKSAISKSLLGCGLLSASISANAASSYAISYGEITGFHLDPKIGTASLSSFTFSNSASADGNGNSDASSGLMDAAGSGLGDAYTWENSFITNRDYAPLDFIYGDALISNNQILNGTGAASAIAEASIDSGIAYATGSNTMSANLYLSAATQVDFNYLLSATLSSMNAVGAPASMSLLIQVGDWSQLMNINSSVTNQNMSATTHELAAGNHALQLTMTNTINLTPVPVPAAAWLFGSGLLGLVGVARRRKAA